MNTPTYTPKNWGWGRPTQMSTHPHGTPDAGTHTESEPKASHTCLHTWAAYLPPGARAHNHPLFLLFRRTSPPHAHPHQHSEPSISAHRHLHTHFPAASSPRDPARVSLPTTLGSFCLRSGIRGSFMLMRLKRPHSRCGGFFLPSESSLRGGGGGVKRQGRGLSEGAGPRGRFLLRGSGNREGGASPKERAGPRGRGGARTGRAGHRWAGKGPAARPTGCVLSPGEPDRAGPHLCAGSLPRQAQQQPSSESSRPRSRASSAPAPITPLRWLVSVGY